MRVVLFIIFLIVFPMTSFCQDILNVSSIEEATNISLDKLRKLNIIKEKELFISYEYFPNEDSLNLKNKEFIKKSDCDVFYLNTEDYIFTYKMYIKVINGKINVETVLYRCKKESATMQEITFIYSDETTYVVEKRDPSHEQN